MTDRLKLKQRFLRAQKVIFLKYGMTPRKTEFFAKRKWDQTVKGTK